MNEKIENAIKGLMETLENGEVEYMAKAIFKGTHSKPSDRWSFLNRLIMLSNGTQDARTYATWLKVKRHVKKGSKAFYILQPIIGKKPKKNEDEEDKPALYGFKTIPEFGVEDTEGEPVLIDSFDANIPAKFDKIISDLNLDVQTSAFTGSFYGFYSPGSKEIVLASPDLSVFVHELCHAVDDKMHGIKEGQIKDQEIIAEFGAAVICRLLGYETETKNNFVAYIKNYGGDSKDIIRLLNRLDKVISYIITNTTNN